MDYSPCHTKNFFLKNYQGPCQEKSVVSGSFSFIFCSFAFYFSLLVRTLLSGTRFASLLACLHQLGCLLAAAAAAAADAKLLAACSTLLQGG